MGLKSDCFICKIAKTTISQIAKVAKIANHNLCFFAKIANFLFCVVLFECIRWTLDKMAIGKTRPALVLVPGVSILVMKRLPKIRNKDSYHLKKIAGKVREGGSYDQKTLKRTP